MLDKYKDMYKFQQQARAIQKELKKAKFTANSSSSVVTVVVNGIQEVEEVQIDFGEKADYYTNNPLKLGSEIRETTNKAMKKAQKASAERMQSIMGEGGMPPGF